MAEFGTLPLRSDANVQAYYKLENVNDDLGVNNLTNNNTATFEAAKYGNGVSGGSSDADKSLTIANRLGYTGGAYAMSFWVRIITEPGSGVQYQFCSVTDDTTSNSRLTIFYNNNAGTREIYSVRTKVGTGDENGTPYAVDLGTSVLHHVVLSYDGSTVKLYLDNVERQSYSASGNGATDTTNKFSILEGFTANGDSTLGIIDDFVPLDRALTVPEIASIYAEGTSGLHAKYW